MVSRTWLLGLILAVPLVGFGVAQGLQAHFNSELHDTLRKQFPDASVNQLAAITIEDLCTRAEFSGQEFCSTNWILGLMSGSAVGAGIVGLFLLVAIRSAGSAARNSRRLLLYVFRPGLYLTALLLIGLVIVHAAVAMGAIWYGESALVGRVHVGIIAGIGIGAVLGVAGIARSVFGMVRKAETLVIGSTASESEQAVLWRNVNQVADRLKALRPDNIVIGLDPNFFVTEADVICLNGRLSGRTLYCSLPLARVLSGDELSAVIGHELGHFKGLDTKFSRRFYPIYHGTATALAHLQLAGQQEARSIALLPAIAILSYFFESFAVAEKSLSRERELAADSEGASITSPATLATALVKVHAFAPLWGHLQEAALKALAEGKAFVNMSKTYAEAITDGAAPESLVGIDGTHLSHPTDSHPPLGTRLQALHMEISQVTDSALTLNPATPAIAWITDPEKHEQALSDAYQAILARQLPSQPAAAPGAA